MLLSFAITQTQMEDKQRGDVRRTPSFWLFIFFLKFSSLLYIHFYSPLFSHLFSFPLFFFLLTSHVPLLSSFLLTSSVSFISRLLFCRVPSLCLPLLSLLSSFIFMSFSFSQFPSLFVHLSPLIPFLSFVFSPFFLVFHVLPYFLVTFPLILYSFTSFFHCFPVFLFSSSCLLLSFVLLSSFYSLSLHFY